MSVQVPKGYKQTEVGVIPEDWSSTPVRSFANVVRGGSPRPAGDPKYFNGSYIPWLTVASLTGISPNNLYVNETSTCLTEEGANYSRLLNKGALIIANSGATLGVAKILNISCCANDGIAALDQVSDGVELKFIAHYVNYKTQYLREVVATGNGQPNLNTDLIGGFHIPLPKYCKEQQAIAEALSDADALIESLEQLIAKKRQIKQGAMQELLTGQLRLPGFSGAWVRRSLDEVADVIDPHPSHRAPNEVSNGIPFLGIGDFDEYGNIVGKKLRFVDSSILEEHAVRYCLDDDLIGLGRVASIGKVVSLKKHEDGYAISPTLGVIRGRDVGRDFLIYSLKSNFVKEQFLKIMSGSTRSSVGMQVLRELIIELPPSKEEQNSIATCLKDMAYEIEMLEMRLDKARQIKQAMMQELLTGRIRLI